MIRVSILRRLNHLEQSLQQIQQEQPTSLSLWDLLAKGDQVTEAECLAVWEQLDDDFKAELQMVMTTAAEDCPFEKRIRDMEIQAEAKEAEMLHQTRAAVQTSAAVPQGNDLADQRDLERRQTVAESEDLPDYARATPRRWMVGILEE